MPYTLGDFDQREDGPMLNISDICEVLGLGRQTVREMVKAGDIRGAQIGLGWKVPWRSFRVYLRRTRLLPLRAEERL